ncbi:MAG TPA: NAD(P)/FAD-dependent oxidoreductase, partial [Nevskiaceae bacterium]|nr:NAD(P)/FAD-dependent oxidoreductase [Nevskiaceae bacterium]
MAQTAAGRRDPRVVIVGAGMSGMLMGIMLKRAGIESFEIYEKAAKVGGTWRENSYPGLACDVPAYMYTYRFEPWAEWSRRFAHGPEIQKYFEHVYAKYGLEKYIRCNAEVVSAVHEDGAWTVTLKDGTRTRADMVISAAGILHHPSLPDIPGLASFAGKSFHSARWDHSVKLDDQRIGIIGTGSTAAQIVGALGGKVKKLVLFQRTAQWVHRIHDAEYSEWSKRLMRRFTWLPKLMHWWYTTFFHVTFARIAVNSWWVMAALYWGCRSNLNSV